LLLRFAPLHFKCFALEMISVKVRCAELIRFDVSFCTGRGVYGVPRRPLPARGPPPRSAKQASGRPGEGGRPREPFGGPRRGPRRGGFNYTIGLPGSEVVPPRNPRGFPKVVISALRPLGRPNMPIFTVHSALPHPAG